MRLLSTASLGAALLLSGCASSKGASWLDEKLANKPVCAADKTESFVVSEWWFIRFASKLTDGSTPIICGAPK